MTSRRQRDRRLAELRLAQQRARQAQAQRRRRLRVRVGSAVVVLLVLAAAGKLLLGGGGSTPEPVAVDQPCTYTPDGTSSPRVLAPPVPPVGAQPRRNGLATLVLDEGTVTFALLANDAPCAVTSTAYLAAHRYYDGSRCDRLASGPLQLLQCGDKPAQGTGPGYTFPDENLTPGTTYPAGTVGLVNHGPDTNGAAFFLCYGDTQLPPQYVPFGRVVTGLDVLQRIAAGGSRPAGDGVPLLGTTIRSLRTSGV